MIRKNIGIQLNEVKSKYNLDIIIPLNTPVTYFPIETMRTC